MAATQTTKLECLEVREAGRALKVQSDNPHLVSIGSGRLSTNVTWHPLPEGKVTIGSSQNADIVVQGTGVEPRHCVIENSFNLVTLYPLAEMTTIDGLPVTIPTRLSQGNMICIGRSNYLRFNHPAEANLMKKFLPNTRISMAAPLNFFGNGDPPFERKPPVAPQRRSRDSWGDQNAAPDELSAPSKASKFDYLTECQNKISPKVFPPGSTTVNSPAEAVLGHSRIPNGLLAAAAQEASARTKSVSPSVKSENGTIDFIEAPVPQTIASYPQKATISYSQPQNKVLQNGFGNPLFAGYSCDGRHHGACRSDDAPPSREQSPKTLALPSPAFNRNPSPYVPDRLRSVTPNMFSAKNSAASTARPAPRSLTPSSGGSLPFPKDGDGDAMSRSCDSSLCRGFGSNQSHEKFDTRRDKLELRMLQAQEDRKREQEAQLLEKQRLEEILTMCAEYERQVQQERQTKLPTTPTLQQNRIKTNGSLPRDKRSNGISSPIANSNSEDELTQIFTFESKSLPRNKSQAHDGARTGGGRLKLDSSIASRSPYENLSKFGREEDSLESSRPSNYDVTSVVSRHIYVENTLIIKPQNSLDGEKLSSQHPHSPRTRIRTTVREQSPREQIDLANHLAILCDYDTVDPIKLRNASPNLQRRKFLTPSQQLNEFNDLIIGNQKERDEFILPVNGENDLSDLMKNLEMEFSNSLLEFRNSQKSVDVSPSEVKKDDCYVNDEFNNDLPESERHINQKSILDDGERGEIVKSPGKNADSPVSPIEGDKRKRENCLRLRKKNDEMGRLKIEKSTWLGIITRLKSGIHDIEQQEEEILREVRMEEALVNAEYLAQKEKHNLEEDKLNGLRDKQKQLDNEIDQCKARDSELQKNCNERIEELKREIENAEMSLGKDKEFSEDYKNLTEKLEAEKKSFEDLEFKQLEEEANWLATKDDLQREIFDISLRLETRKSRLAELENQIHEMEKLSQAESSSLETQKIKLLQQLEEARTKLKELDVRLSSENDTGEDNSSDRDETGSIKLRPKSKQSQEDLVRISKVTSDAPIDMGKTGSLGRKTVESLKEIERIRQIHLVKQGSQVIEEERKRVEQLKRRVQDEVRAQWEQSRQRECNSLNSVGSEESSLTCSDQPTESASSDDVDKALTPTMASNLPEINDQEMSEEKLRSKDQDCGDYRNSRPISDYSCSDFEQQVVVKKRDLKPIRLLQQRPLTRYLPIRSETLNLRQHIESAGHQVDLCHHVTIDATSCRGVLHKLGGKFHNWNKRWFVFDRTRRTLVYYVDKMEKKQRGGTYFQAIEEVYVDHLNSVKSPQPHLTFVIKTHERTYHLMAPSPEAMRIWVDVIFTGAEGYQEFEHGS